MTEFFHTWGPVLLIVALAAAYGIYVWIEVRIDNRALRHFQKLDGTHCDCRKCR